MSIAGISDGTSVYDLLKLYTSQAAGSVPTTGSKAACASGGSTDSVSLSEPAQLFSKLQQLAQTDPEKFKVVCQSIADKLNEAAQGQDGGSSKMLSDLASKFESAAETGDVSQIKPPPPPPMPPSTGSMQDVLDLYSQNQSTSIGRGMQGMFGQSGQGISISDIIQSALDEAGISV